MTKRISNPPPPVGNKPPYKVIGDTRSPLGQPQAPETMMVNGKIVTQDDYRALAAQVEALREENNQIVNQRNELLATWHITKITAFNVVEGVIKNNAKNVDQHLFDNAVILKSLIYHDNSQQHLREIRADAVQEYKATNPSVADHLVRQITFSLKAFGPALRTGGVIDHIRKELVEVSENPHDLSEWIDIAMLALDGAWRHAVRNGRTHEDIAREVAAALQAKLAKNEKRTWPDWRLLSEDKAIEHDRTGEYAAKVGEA